MWRFSTLPRCGSARPIRCSDGGMLSACERRAISTRLRLCAAMPLYAIPPTAVPATSLAGSCTSAYSGQRWQRATSPPPAHAGSQVLAFNATGLTLARVVLGVMKLAKHKQDWQAVLEWSSKVTADLLNSKPVVVGDKRYMSSRHTWCLGRSRDLYELKRFAGARDLARAGLAESPGEVFLMRTAALALAGSSDVIGAIAEMRSVAAGSGAGWYMKSELAELLFRAHDYPGAYRLMCDAVSDRKQSDQYKVRCFAVLARLALKLGKPHVAAEHVALAKAIYAESGWKVPADAVQAEREVKAAYGASGHAWPDLPDSSNRFAQICAAHWRAGAAEGLQFYTGTVKDYPEGRLFAYIRRDDGGGDVYVSVRAANARRKDDSRQISD